MDMRTRNRSVQRGLTVIVSFAVVLALAAWWGSERPWWQIEDFGCPQGYFRVNHGRPIRVEGACGGLSPKGEGLNLSRGDVVDVHMLYFKPVATTNPTIMFPTGGILDLGSQHFRAISKGRAVLYTDTIQYLCGGWNAGPESPEAQTPKRCPVLVVTVLR